MARTIQDILDLMVAAVPGAPRKDSVDTIKCGDPAQPLTGIVTTFTATIPVLRRAVALGANLVITHEPTFYDHTDTTDWLVDDPVYQAKRDFVEQHGLTIWRFHDYWHMHQPDGIITGMLRALGWESYAPDDDTPLVTVPKMTLATLVATFKEKLALPTLRVIGDPNQVCERIALLVGSPGGAIQVRAFQIWAADVVVCGETVEWQTCEYVRDALALGYHKALLIVGHAKSEEEGMHYLADWLHVRASEVPITYLAVGDPVTTF